MPARRPLETLEDAYEEAVRLLARKPRTEREVADALEARGADRDDVESVLGRLKAHRHLDDAELAHDQAFTLLEGKGYAPELAVQALVQRGIAPALAGEAVDAARDGRSERALCEAAFRRRVKGRLSPDDVGREGRALARLGFDAEIVARVLEQALGAVE